jgi:phosphohistidine phosphatase
VKHTLYVLRHAKSSWAEPTLPDHERPLAPRGERACTLIAEHLRSKRIFADLVLCSSSKRTRDTLELIAPALGDHPDIRVEERLYQATRSDLLARLREIAENVRSVLVIGHDPALQELVLELATENKLRNRVRAKFPTAALATLLSREPWARFSAGSLELTAFVRPKDVEPSRH